MALKSHKIALRATDKQRVWFAQQCGYARFAYNYALSDFKDSLSQNEWRSRIDLNNRFNAVKYDKFDWCASLDQRAAVYGIINLGDAIKRWRSGQNNFPQYKKRSHRQSYTVEGAKVKVAGKHIRLPKIGRIRMFETLRFEGEISLADRQYHCESCGFTEDRDVNAAINLKNLAIGSVESLNA